MVLEAKDKECMKNGHLEVSGVIDLSTGTVAPDQKTLVQLLEGQR